MVSLWGVIDVECAKHTTLHQFDRDPHATLRHYQPAVAVETDVGEQLDDGANNDGFRRLAFYIGVFGEPTNRAVSYVQMPPPDDDDQTGSTVDRTTPGEVCSSHPNPTPNPTVYTPPAYPSARGGYCREVPMRSHHRRLRGRGR